MPDPREELAKKLQELLGVTTAPASRRSVALTEEKEHKFWRTQPVPQSAQDLTLAEMGPLRNDDPDAIRKTPLSLPADFEWCTLHLATSEEDLDALHQLLTAHYVEDQDAMFRFAYSLAFLRWALMPPAFNSDWHVGVRVKASGKLVAFISGIPLHLRVREHDQRMAEVNFLCVHKRLRSKRLAPVLIREVTRRINLTGVYQAVYTAGVRIPSPISTVRYFHRSLNPAKLTDTGFSYIPHGMSFGQYQKRFQLPKTLQMPGIRPMRPDDVVAVSNLVNASLRATCDFGPVFGTAEAEHWLCPVPDVVWAWVVTDGDTITDYVSLYSLPSTVIGHPIHNEVRAAYLYYHAVTVPGADGMAAGELDAAKKARTERLIQDALILAKNAGFDVFNALALMGNGSFMEALRFAPGDGYLNYYLFNWRSAPVTPERIGLVML